MPRVAFERKWSVEFYRVQESLRNKDQSWKNPNRNKFKKLQRVKWLQGTWTRRTQHHRSKYLTDAQKRRWWVLTCSLQDVTSTPSLFGNLNAWRFLAVTVFSKYSTRTRCQRNWVQFQALSLAWHRVFRTYTTRGGLSIFKMQVKCFSPADLRIILNIKRIWYVGVLGKLEH